MQIPVRVFDTFFWSHARIERRIRFPTFGKLDFYFNIYVYIHRGVGPHWDQENVGGNPMKMKYIQKILFSHAWTITVVYARPPPPLDLPQRWPLIWATKYQQHLISLCPSLSAIHFSSYIYILCHIVYQRAKIREKP